jgi:hypothetical protein
MTVTTEAWLPVVGFEGQYEVSDHGRVRGVDRIAILSDGRRIPVQGCVLKLRRRKKGYLQVSLQRDGRPTAHAVHRLVLLAFVGPCPEGMECCHNNGDKSNNMLGNLRWDTQSANTLDLVRHGTHNMARKTHCKRGHRLELPNLKPSALRTGRRACLSCNRAESLASQAARRGRAVVDIDMAADTYYERLMSVA